MYVPKFIKSYLYQTLFVASGILIGVNNYDLIKSAKSRVEDLVEVDYRAKKLEVLEDLIKQKEVLDEEVTLF